MNISTPHFLYRSIYVDGLWFLTQFDRKTYELSILCSARRIQTLDEHLADHLRKDHAHADAR